MKIIIIDFWGLLSFLYRKKMICRDTAKGWVEISEFTAWACLDMFSTTGTNASAHVAFWIQMAQKVVFSFAFSCLVERYY